MLRFIVASVTFASACTAPRPAGEPIAQRGLDGIAAEISRARKAVAHAKDPHAAAALIVAHWQIPSAHWDSIVLPQFRDAWQEYAHAFDTAAPALVDALVALAKAPETPLTPGFEYAGDRSLSLAQSRVRIALPVGGPGLVIHAGLDDKAPCALDAVFVFDGDTWRSLTGLDDAMRSRIAAFDAQCATDVATAGRLSRCNDVAGFALDAAMRDDKATLARACTMVRAYCR